MRNIEANQEIATSEEPEVLRGRWGASRGGSRVCAGGEWG